MAKKSEWLYRELLYRSVEKRGNFFTQSALAKRCDMSIGNVNRALKPLERTNCIQKKPRGFSVINQKKLLIFWASMRNLEKDILFRTRVNAPVSEIEKRLPPVKFTAYSAYKFRFGSVPADYSEVIAYGNPAKVKERFGKKGGKPNIIVLKADAHLAKFREVPLAQVYVDLWNLGTWYAEDFLRALEKKIGMG